MKKYLLAIIITLIGIALNAQVSIWDGTAEIWTHGSGTQEDPFLIESAQNLAYIAVKTNEYLQNSHENRMMYADTCFLLTVDIDFGADAGMEWEPIGINGTAWGKGRFSGHFDGGGHSFTNLTISNDDADFFGIFGYMEGGSLKNIVVEGNDINISHIYTYGNGPVGLLLGYGIDVTIENCVNNANVYWETINIDTGNCNLGGLFGCLVNSSITNCHNHGDISAPESTIMYNGPKCGGIAGCFNNCVVSDCSNYGHIYFKNGEYFLVNYIYGGGIAGVMTGTITNCSNNGNLYFEGDVSGDPLLKAVGGIIGYTASEFGGSLVVGNCYSNCNINVVDDDTEPSWAGGIVGYITDTINVTIQNCYCASSDMLTDYTGGIVGRANDNTAVNNCYYINALTSVNDYGSPKPESEMRTQEFVDLLNDGGDVYAMDLLYVNGGFPIFSRYTGISENESRENISVYPNPAKEYVQIIVSDESCLQSAEIYTLDGRLVFETQDATAQPTTINVANLKSGVYVIKVKLTDGNDYVAKIVKE
jgi:hypothetical protein